MQFLIDYLSTVDVHIVLNAAGEEQSIATAVIAGNLGFYLYLVVAEISNDDSTVGDFIAGIVAVILRSDTP